MPNHLNKACRGGVINAAFSLYVLTPFAGKRLASHASQLLISTCCQQAKQEGDTGAHCSTYVPPVVRAR